MNRLALLLKKMQDVNWVTRPSDDTEGQESVGPQTDIVKSDVSPVDLPGQTPLGQPPQPPKPISPQALDSVAGDIRASQPEAGYAPTEATKPAYGRKMDQLATMGKLQNLKYPELKPKKTLAGGGYGSGIF